MIRWLREFIFEQKCIPWRFRSYTKRLMLMLGRFYDNEFFDSSHRQMIYQTSVIPVVLSLINKYNPKSLIDIGCGDGLFLSEFKKHNIEIMGCDNSREGLKRCKLKRIPITKFNIVKDTLAVNKQFDLAICFEVAEHIPNFASEKLVSTLCNISKVIAFTAAPPGQGGDNHINEQPHTFWIKKFDYLNFYLDNNDTNCLKDKWRKAGVVNYMIDNLMMFKRKNNGSC